MNIKPILKYPGAKWGLASWITSYFPAHTRYLEPYCGSAAIFFNKTPAVTEHGNTRMEVLWINPKAAGERQLSLFATESAGVAV